MSVSESGREGEAPILGGTAHASLFDKCGRHRLASLLHFVFFSTGLTWWWYSQQSICCCCCLNIPSSSSSSSSSIARNIWTRRTQHAKSSPFFLSSFLSLVSWLLHDYAVSQSVTTIIEAAAAAIVYVFLYLKKGKYFISFVCLLVLWFVYGAVCRFLLPSFLLFGSFTHKQ